MEEEFKVDFIGIGVPRAGTTWLSQCLDEHPEICVAKVKETYFFNKNDLFEQGLKYYRTFFNGCGQNKIKGEFTPSYMHSSEALKRIKTAFPEVKIIICLRNPIERACSHFWKDYLSGRYVYHANNFSEVVNNPDNKYINESFYYEGLKEVFSYFDRKKVLVLILENVKENRVICLQKVYNFLGVQNNFAPLLINKPISQTGSARSKVPIISGLIYRVRFIRNRAPSWFVWLCRKMRVREFINFILRVNYLKSGGRKFDKPKVSQQERLRLQEIFKDDISKLEDLLQTDLSFWN